MLLPYLFCFVVHGPCLPASAGGGSQTPSSAPPPQGPRPRISWAPGAIFPGDEIAVKHGSADPVTKALLIRTGTHTHSMAFDARAVWLTLESKQVRRQL